MSIDTISKYFKKSKRTISNWLQELEEKKLIKRLQLENNGVAHTFLIPYGELRFHDPNSLQKGLVNKHISHQPNTNDIDIDDLF